MAFSWAWIANPTHDIFLEPLGYWLGVLGFGVTIAGFWIGYVKLRRVQASADAAALAVQSFKLRLVHYEALNDATEAGAAVAAIRRYIASTSWKDVGETYDDVRNAMARICLVLTSQDAAILAEIIAMKGQIADFCSTIEVSLNTDKPFPNIPKTLKMIRTHSDLIGELQHILRERSL